uniref:Uncharacterized protein LOC114326842 n=1 Tax=Diabrotica virgifera virgifera TaxID=50390 RepID=A0A6P7F5U2_DIAVI
MKRRIYKTVIRPKMTYGAETRSDTERTRRLLETAEMKTLRKIDGKTLWDRVRSTDIRRRCKVDNINNWVRNRRIEWNDHISRMTTNRVVRKTIGGKTTKTMEGQLTRGTLKKQTVMSIQKEEEEKKFSRSNTFCRSIKQ